MSITTSQSAYPVAVGVGRFVTSLPGVVTLAALRTSWGTTRVLNMTVGTATNPFAYIIRGRSTGNDWTEASFTTSATTDTALRNGLIAAWNANAVLRGLALAASGSGVSIDWTAVTEGAAGFLEVEIVANSNSALGTPTVTTAGADAVETPFGRYVNLTAPNTYAHLTALAGPTITYTLTYAASDTASASIIAQAPDGTLTTFSVSGVATGADLPAFLAAYNAALTAALAGTGATVTTASPTIVVAFPVGWVIATSESAATPTSDVTNVVAAGSAVPSLALVVDDQGQSPTTIGSTVTGYAAGKAALLLRTGPGSRLAVENPGTTPTFGGAVYVETAAGDNLGRPYTAPSPSRVRHPSHTWVLLDSVSPSLAVIGA